MNFKLTIDLLQSAYRTVLLMSQMTEQDAALALSQPAACALPPVSVFLMAVPDTHAAR